MKRSRQGVLIFEVCYLRSRWKVVLPKKDLGTGASLRVSMAKHQKKLMQKKKKKVTRKEPSQKSFQFFRDKEGETVGGTRLKTAVGEVNYSLYPRIRVRVCT